MGLAPIKFGPNWALSNLFGDLAFASEALSPEVLNSPKQRFEYDLISQSAAQWQRTAADYVGDVMTME